MAIRLILTIEAVPGKGTELAQRYKSRCEEVMKEPGCEQYEVFLSAINPDKLVVLERWTDQEALDVHAKRNRSHPPTPTDLRVGKGEREDYVYNRTR